MASKRAKKSAEAAPTAEEGLELAPNASLERLQATQAKLKELDDDLDTEVFKIQKEFQKKRLPYYQQRSEAIRSIDNFWLIALTNHPVLGSLISDEDQLVLRYVEDIFVEDEFEKGYAVKFSFKENPYFENRELVKEIKVDVSEQRKQPVIKWKKGMNVIEKVEKRLAASSEKGGNKRSPPIDEDEALESFFVWFTVEPESFGDDEEIDEVGDVFRQDLWLNPVRYFLGKVEGSDDDGDVGESDEDDEGNEDDDNYDAEADE